MAIFGTDRPKRPRPKQLKFDDDTYGFIDASDEISVGTQVFAYTGAVDVYGGYELADNGTYEMVEPFSAEIVIVDGVITDIND